MPVLVTPTRPFTDALLAHYRQQGDAPADAVIATLVTADGPASLRTLMRWLADTADFSTDAQHPAVQEFFSQCAPLPAWADPARMQRGMAFFQKNAQKIGLVLGLFSLPYTYLGANGAQVLWITERIKTDTARRLQETGEWVFAVNNPKEWAKGTAVLRTLKIRLIHAGARWFSLHSGKWNETWGYPVNQEDMAGTNIAFAYIVLLGLRKSGVVITSQEEEDFLHHTGVVNALIGVTDALLPRNMREAYTLNRAIAQRQFAPSEAGIGLTKSLLNAVVELAGKPSSEQRSVVGPETIRNLTAGEMRFFLGDEHADWLGIPKAPVEKRLAGLLSRLPIFPNVL